MRYFVLYNDANRAQRIAQTDSDTETAQYINAGFVEVDQATYESLEGRTPIATIADLVLLASAVAALSQIVGVARNQQRLATLPDASATIAGLEQSFRRNAAQLTRDYYAGQIDLQSWYQGMARNIRSHNIASRAASVGGLQNLSRQDIRALEGGVIDSELRYLNRFRQSLELGDLSEAQAVNRAQLYAGTVVPTYEEGRQDAIGLPPLPAQPKVRTRCQRNCKCTWRIIELDGNGNFDCYWDRSPVDSCDTCRTREQRFNPLRIRNGIIQPFNPVGIYA